jgi:hypothetical protein
LDALASQEGVEGPVDGGAEAVGGHGHEVVAAGDDLRGEARERDAERFGRRLHAAEVDDEAEVVVLVGPPSALSERSGDVAGGALALPLGVLRGHRRDLAGAGHVGYGRDVAARPHVRLARNS